MKLLISLGLLMEVGLLLGVTACEQEPIEVKEQPWHDSVGKACDKQVVIVTWNAIEQIRVGMSKREISSVIGGKLNCPIESGLLSLFPKDSLLYSVQFKFNEAGSTVEGISYRPATVEFEDDE